MEKRSGKIFQMVIVTVTVSIITGVPRNSSELNNEYRLPKYARPITYELSLESAVHLQGITNFGGKIKIKIEMVQEAHEIKLNNRDLTINTVKLKDSTDSEMEKTHSVDSSKEFLIITSLEALEKNKIYYVEIEFNGRLKISSPTGFYRTQYTIDGDTDSRFLAATQFEPTRAREAFPCFDEPEFKATFVLTITHGSDYHALSNTDGETEKIDNGLSITKFKETAKMSTYLLAFVISDLKYFTMPNPNGLRQRVYSRPEYIQKSFTVPGYLFSKKFLELLEEKFDMKFDETIGKMDSIALPDHGSAMENWGLILYKEQYLVLEANPHPYEMYDVVGTIAHEIVHQFFGNLVTCKWYDQIWLNEGIATLFEFQLPELFATTKPLRFYELFNIRRTQDALRIDSLESSRPMTHDETIPKQISNLFDDIAYDKSGAVLRMFQHAIGDELFTNGLKHYLATHQYESVTSDDLLTSIESVLPESFDMDVKRAFKTWELQQGYPMITVSFNQNENQFYIKQKRYLSLGEKNLDEENSSWYIPLSYTTGVNPNFENSNFTDYFVDETNEKIISTDFDGSQWFIFNIHQLGYYRVNYDENNWNRIIQVLNSDDYQKIHVLNRAQLVDDALTFAYDGVISYETAFGIVGYLERETDYIPWHPASIAFDKLDYLLKGTDAHKDFQRFIGIIIRRVYAVHDFKSVDSLTNSEQLAVELAIDLSCRAGSQKCLKNAHEQMKSRNMLKPLEITYICNGMKGINTIDEYEYLFNRMDKSYVQNERMRIIKGLLCSSDREILEKFVRSSVTGNTFYRGYEINQIFESVTEKSSVGLEVLVGVIEEHFDSIESRTYKGYIDKLLIDASKRISAENDEKLITELLSKLDKKINLSTKEAIVKHIKFNKDWASSSKSTAASVFIHNFLKSFDDFEKVLRLPKISQPYHYEIILNVQNVQTGALSYNGEVKIDVKILKRTNKLILHSKGHEISELTVHEKSTLKDIRVLDFSQNEDADTLIIYFFDFIPTGSNIQINIKFTAKLRTVDDGFYLNSYLEFDEFVAPITKYYAATQFQPIKARTAFPCYDEPEYKATVDANIRHHTMLNAVSNMPVKEILKNDDGTTNTIFHTTPTMSIYLLAFLISDFKFLTNKDTKTPEQVLQNIYTRPGKEEKTKYALKNSMKVLEELEKFVPIKFDLPKLDLVALPKRNNAMENWGLIMASEYYLIYENDEDAISHELMRKGLPLIAHETAHMFFGNLVTAEWWNFLWLNEGFATYLMYHIAGKTNPEWKFESYFNTIIMQENAMVTDSYDEARSLSAEVIITDDIENIPVDITYNKAGCVIRMFHHALGDKIFREALTLYLSDNKYKSVTSQHLINAVQQVLDSNSVDLNFDQIFRTWEHQKGFPVVYVSYQIESSSFRLTQQTFSFDKIENDKRSWYIPINYCSATNIDFEDTKITHYFPKEQSVLLIHDPSYNGNDWYIFNKQQIGYYRVNYDEKNWDALINILNSEEFEKIHELNRVQLISDSFALAKAEHIDFDIPYKILMYLRREKNFFAWCAADYSKDNDLFIFGTKNELIQKFDLLLSKKFYDHYKLSSRESIPNEQLIEREGRELATRIACNAGNEDCIQDAKTYGAKDAKNIQKLPDGLERTFLCIYFRHTDTRDDFINIFNRMNKLYALSESQYKNNLIKALACTKSPEYLYELLETSIGMDENNVNYTLENRLNIFISILDNPNGIAAVLKLIGKYHGREITDAYEWSWSRILTEVIYNIYTEFEKSAFLEMMNKIDHPEIKRDDIDEAIKVADFLLNKQKETNILKQMEIIRNIIENEFHETTIQPPSTTHTTTEPTEPVTDPSYPTTESPTTTPPDSAASAVLNILILIIAISIVIFLN